MTHSPEFKIWQGMGQRCHNPRDIGFPNYGGRGIEVCVRWRESFEAFFADMGPRPSPKHTIDRVDNNGPYSPENCRWTTMQQQQRNKRDNVIAVSGVARRMCVMEAAQVAGILPNTVYERLRRGWSMERVLLPDRQYSRGQHWAIHHNRPSIMVELNGKSMHLADAAR